MLAGMQVSRSPRGRVFQQAGTFCEVQLPLYEVLGISLSAYEKFRNGPKKTYGNSKFIGNSSSFGKKHKACMRQRVPQSNTETSSICGENPLRGIAWG